jgi:hypothetical protein
MKLWHPGGRQHFRPHVNHSLDPCLSLLKRSGGRPCPRRRSNPFARTAEDMPSRGAIDLNRAGAEADDEQLLAERGAQFSKGELGGCAPWPLLGSSDSLLPCNCPFSLLWILLCSAGPAFYRPESSQGRDLSVLAAAVYKRERQVCRVLDVMAGSGVRGAR